MISPSWKSGLVRGLLAGCACALLGAASEPLASVRLAPERAPAERAAPAQSASADTMPRPDPTRTRAFRDAVYALAADSMEGRGIGTDGIGRAAAWIERRMKATNLQPAFAKSYRQRFPIKTGVSLLPGNRIEGIDSTEWIPLGFTSSGDFEGELVFVGYGIDAPAIGLQEYEGIDLRGKIALMLRYEPQEKDDASPFDGKRPSRWSALRYKAMQARERGAKAVLFVTGPLQDEGNDKIPALKNDGPESPAGIPVAQVRLSAASRWLARGGIDLLRFQRDVDRDLVSRSRAIPAVTIRGRIAVEDQYAESENIVGIIPGKGRLKSETVVVGAHYDHLGWGGQSSMRPNDRAIHNGADDNASGTAAVLVAAERLKKDLARLASHRTIVVALFSAEEVGLAGSSWFVEHPPIPVEKIAAMVNLDMVGRLREKTLVALGLESAPEWEPLLRAAAVDTKLDVTARGDGYGPSDQTSFYAKGIPVLHLFTGAHEQYHSPEDDPETVNHEGGALVARFTEVLVRGAATRDRRLTYARANAAPTMSGDSRGYGAYLGTVPDFRAMEGSSGGVLLADVRAGGPAEVAGIRGGDRLISMAGTRIENLYDMTYALQDHKPGQTVEVTVVRSGETVTFRVTLGDRARMGQAGPAVAKAEPPAQHPHVAANTPAAPAPKPAPPMPGNPHASLSSGPSGSPGAETGAAAVDSFYLGRPGDDFVVKAGKPFASPAAAEGHLTDIRQLTFGGENAEGYFAPDGKKIIFQATPRGAKCDQQYVLDLETGETKMVSTGKGRTTCGYFDYPEADRIVYGSTHGASESCPPPPDFTQGYVWAIYDTYDIWEAKPDGSSPKKLTDSPGYDAEATWCHRGGKLVFTSTRDGDLELYQMDESGQVRRLTNAPGYDGGAFYSPDCSQIIFRASRPTGAKLEDYRKLLSRGLIRPGELEIYVMNADGTGIRQLTQNGAANFCPTFHPDGKRILYASNSGSAGPREFDLWLLDTRGGKAEQVTTASGFDGFPHFSPDGRFVVWASNRADAGSNETNLFIARWKD